MPNLKIGAVIYAPKVTVIWNIIANFFREEGFPIDTVYYKDYISQVDGLFNGEIDIAWNSPLAWVDAYIRAKGKALDGPMRDTDRDRKSYLVVKKDSNIKKIEDLKNKIIGFGAIDSPQARLIPIYHLHKNGLEYNKDYIEKRFDLDVGLQGDHIGGELDSAKAMLLGEVCASWMLDLNYEAWILDGTLDKNQVTILTETDYFDHCIFSGRPDLDIKLLEKFTEVLYKMDYNNPKHKEMMDMEGLKRWVPGRVLGYEQLQGANKYLNYFKE